EALGLDIEDIAQATRVRAAHIAALESLDLDALPARPFAVGFVRAYARALGLEPDPVVRRFRADAPAVDEDLHAPQGLHLTGHRRVGRLLLPFGLLLGAVVAWNVTRHSAGEAKTAPARSASAHARPPRTPALSGPARLGPPLPAPPEAAAPPTYQTPGLPGPEATIGKSEDQEPTVTAGKPFVSAGTIYGAAGSGSQVILQARKPTSLIVRGGFGAVYFARQLASGEAWRAPDRLSGLTIDVGNPASIEVFVGGLSRGPLANAQTPLSSIEK
ncbi:MAG: helix-turn-helix domain-containing protein, partial [Pseudomonadota bacterium]|nr:helix-turn-helix domain-containing protein [Pseudomonadota bacterium]